MKIEHIRLDRLQPYARNSRTHSPAQVEQIAASIREYGFTNPVLIDAEGGIIAGHGRVLAAGVLKLPKVPCIRLAHLSEAQKRAYVIADNKIAEGSGWDNAMLALEIQALIDAGADTTTLAFSADEIDELLGEYTGNLEDGALDANAAAKASEDGDEGEGWDESKQTQPAAQKQAASPSAEKGKAPPLYIPILINLTQAELVRWRDIKKANGLPDNAEAFKRLTGIIDNEGA